MKRFNILTTIIIAVFFIGNFTTKTLAVTLNEPITMDSIDNNQLYLIVKSNRVEYVGNILKDDGREVLIKTEQLGKIYIPKTEILRISKISNTKQIVRGEFYSAGPFTTRYAFTTNALPLRQGLNYAKLNLYGPEAHFALTDNLSIGIMSTWIVSPFIVVGKYSFKTKYPNLNFSLGTLMGSSGYINSLKTWGGLHFGNVTYGTASNNITFGAGYGYVIPGVTETEALPGDYYTSAAYNAALIERPTHPAKGPIMSLAFITKVGAKASFVFDSMVGFISTKTTKVDSEFTGIDTRYIVRDGTERFTALILMPGMRFQTNENSAFQVSLNTVKIMNWSNNSADENPAFPLPSCSWFYRF